MSIEATAADIRKACAFNSASISKLDAPPAKDHTNPGDITRHPDKVSGISIPKSIKLILLSI